MTGQRKRRSDYGVVRATERDVFLLTWIGEQFALPLDQLLALMNRWKQDEEPDWGPGSLSDETVKWLLKRWDRAGWVEHRKLLAGRPQWVWLSKAGLADMELEYPYMVPSVGRLNHLYLVNAVRLYIERQRPGQVQWTSERRVNVERKAEGKHHLVDGELFYQEKLIAIEVEHTQKSRRRMNSIVQELKRDYEAVWYFVSDQANTVVREAIARVEGSRREGDWNTFVVYPIVQALQDQGR